MCGWSGDGWSGDGRSTRAFGLVLNVCLLERRSWGGLLLPLPLMQMRLLLRPQRRSRDPLLREHCGCSVGGAISCAYQSLGRLLRWRGCVQFAELERRT